MESETQVQILDEVVCVSIRVLIVFGELWVNSRAYGVFSFGTATGLEERKL